MHNIPLFISYTETPGASSWVSF
ncbi:hypothetical protein MTR67_001920 [Solanum verrucosum]|uniref:Uncharacterized protein n=1 Tax=Solanum verrucosum TaxID=315347 RepID=A0AAF0PSR1_SOLVR|nr:hypothetical protein MTR67_001920 [Solanum verrucosum]